VDVSGSESARRTAEESALVDSARGGSQAAFEALYRRHVRKVYGLCLRMSADRTIAEDCTQEAFVQAWRALPAFEGRSAFGTWLHRIAVNAVLAQGRRRRAENLDQQYRVMSPDSGWGMMLRKAVPSSA
jgi:RNA polymerase sigma-70 factor (ECF subfamily)